MAGRDDSDDADEDDNEVDFDLSDLATLEHDFIAHGTTQGELEGQARGRAEGAALGRQQGKELGAELGFYQGCVVLWMALATKHPSRFSRRVRTTLPKLLALLQRTKPDAPAAAAAASATRGGGEEFWRTLPVIRARFKALLAALGVAGHFRYTSDASSTHATGPHAPLPNALSF